MTRNPERSLWSAALLAVLDDYNRDYCRALKRGEDTEPVLAAVRRYFGSRDGRMVCGCAGADIGPDQAVACIARPRAEYRARQIQDTRNAYRTEAAE